MIKMAIVLEPQHWRHRQATGIVCFTDDDTLYDPWVEKLVGVLTTGEDVWLYARKRRDGLFTCQVTARNYGGGWILYERSNHLALSAACEDAERWFKENATV